MNINTSTTIESHINKEFIDSRICLELTPDSTMDMKIVPMDSLNSQHESFFNRCLSNLRFALP